MSIVEQILAADENKASSAAEHAFRLVHSDIAKYADKRYDNVDVSNHFNDALTVMYNHASACAFRRGAAYMLKFLTEISAEEPLNPVRLDEEYARLCGTIKERD